MGQQQLFFLVLAVIIIGTVMIIGINAFGQDAVEANTDAILQDVITIASQAQAWFRKPAMIGGGGRSFAGITVHKMKTIATNENGVYRIINVKENEFVLTGLGRERVLVRTRVFADSIGVPLIKKNQDSDAESVES